MYNSTINININVTSQSIHYNDSYCDKIMIGYYTYILDFCNSEITLCTSVFVCFV